MLRNLSEKLEGKFLATTHATRGYSMPKIAYLGDAFSEIFEQEANPVEGQSMTSKKIRKGEKGKSKKEKNVRNEKPKDIEARSLSRLKTISKF